MQNEKGHTTISPIPSEELYRFGTDGNLRLYSYDRLFYSLYGYDAGTTRTYKYSFDLSPNWVNGRLEAVNFNMHTAMFYPNSYLNFNQDGHYTKHYYNGMERIASRLGEQNLSINVNDPELQDRKDWQDSLIRKQISDISGYQFLEPGEEPDPEDPKPIYELPQIGITDLQPIGGGDIYYYHPNHLGSTCYVTDENASVVQGFLYAPFGEITNEHSPMWQNGTLPKYSFNAKELDEETGMYYYEARYYAPPVFISRDPLFEKYPTFSPYAYCANNPVKYVDPDGEEYRKFEDYENGTFLGEIDDGVDETVRVTASHYNQLKERYNNDIQNNDNSLTSYNEMIERFSIGKVGYDIAQTALKYEGSFNWSYDVRKDNFGKNTYKCNKFIYDVLSENGVAPPGEWPPQAASWAKNGNIKDWKKVTQPNVGDIVAGAYNYTDATGHVVIITNIDLSTGTVSALGTVNSSYIGDNRFGNNMVNNGGLHDGKQYSPGIRRYSGNNR